MQVILPYHNMQMKHWNPGATKPLVLPIQVICNTDDEALFANIRANSPGREWITTLPEHNKIALLVGSGPSMLDDIPSIRFMQRNGAVIFALNNAANTLAKYGVLADYQVILDARKETADLIGPAREHLFASQVHPDCFERMPSAKVWHVQIENIDDALPDYDKPFVLIGGAASVGNTATCLVYAMGFRNLHCFGYDSSHKGDQSHALHQKINDGDPCAYVDFNGKTYLCSLTMKVQAEKFHQTADDLKALGCEITVHGSGLLPDMYNAPKEVLAEAAKYNHMWTMPEYRDFSPGAQCIDKFMELLKPGATVIDFGCGSGKASIKLEKAGFRPLLVDFADNCRDPEAEHLPFHVGDLSLPMPYSAQYGFCADVLEHLPPEQVRSAIHNILDCVELAFFQISTVHDEFGRDAGFPLHLTVRPHSWWKEVIQGLGQVEQEWEGQSASQFVVKRI